jgi:hypothetical protein
MPHLAFVTCSDGLAQKPSDPQRSGSSRAVVPRLLWIEKLVCTGALALKTNASDKVQNNLNLQMHALAQLPSTANTVDE